MCAALCSTPHAAVHLQSLYDDVTYVYDDVTVRLTQQYICKVCLGAGAVTVEGRDLRYASVNRPLLLDK